MCHTEVIDLIVCAGRRKPYEKMNVKQRIRVARGDGHLPRTEKRKGRFWVNTKEFFQWAAQQICCVERMCLI